MPGRTFHSVQATKEFIAAEITAQAQRNGTPLSEIERKMLLYSEAGWAPPDIMDVGDDFDREYDHSEYEKKVSRIIKRLDKRLRKESPAEYQDWRSALEYLKHCDRYVNVMNVMIVRADLRPPWDRVKLVATALLAVVALMCWFFISDKYHLDRYFPEEFWQARGLDHTCRSSLIGHTVGGNQLRLLPLQDQSNAAFPAHNSRKAVRGESGS
jgi:hypothetical protein